MSRVVVVSLLALGTIAVTSTARAQASAPAAPSVTAAAPPPPTTPAPPAASSPPTTLTPAVAPAVAPEVAPIPLAPPPGAEMPKDKDAENGLASPKFRLGAGIGGGFSTKPVTLNVMTRINRTWGIGAEYKFLPSLTFSDSSLSAYAIGADFRWFPGHGSFFVGASVGYQSLKGTISSTSNGVATGFAEELSGMYVTPRVGWLWSWDFGLTLGLDVGVTVPIAPSTSGLGDGDKLDSAMKTFGKLPLPDINLLRVGFLI